MLFRESSYLDRFLARVSRTEMSVSPLSDEAATGPGAASCRLQWMDADGSPASQEALIGCRASNGLVVKCQTPLQPGTEVKIFGGVPGRAAVTFCHPDGSDHVVILVPIMSERRSWEHQPADSSAVLTWRTSDGESHTDTVSVRNLGTDGLQIAAPHAVPVPSVVRIAGEAMACVGATRYCWRAGDQYLLGIQLVQEPYLKQSTKPEENN